VVCIGLNWSDRNRLLPVLPNTHYANVMFSPHHAHWQNWSFVIIGFMETLLLSLLFYYHSATSCN